MGVWHHHHMVFRPTQCLYALTVLRATLVDQVGNGRGADKRQRFNVMVVNQCFDRVFIALHHVEHAIG